MKLKLLREYCGVSNDGWPFTVIFDTKSPGPTPIIIGNLMLLKSTNAGNLKEV